MGASRLFGSNHDPTGARPHLGRALGWGERPVGASQRIAQSQTCSSSIGTAAWAAHGDVRVAWLRSW